MGSIIFARVGVPLRNRSSWVACINRYIDDVPVSADGWIVLTYRVPPEPSRHRVGLWRRLKGMGAVYLQSGACVLPRTAEHIRQLKILENEITEAGGEAVLLLSTALDRAQEEKVIARFKADRDEEYEEFLDKCADFVGEVAKETAAQHFTYAELEENDVDLKKLQGWLEKIRRLDFYGAPLAQQATERLHACEQALEAYAQRVFDAAAEGRDD